MNSKIYIVFGEISCEGEDLLFSSFDSVEAQKFASKVKEYDEVKIKEIEIGKEYSSIFFPKEIDAC